MKRLNTLLMALSVATVLVTPLCGDTVVDFSNHAGLGYIYGTTQTITQNGVEMSVLAGSYEITINPYHELNLKDFDSDGAPRTVQFDFLSGELFNFVGFSRNWGSRNATITSSAGGSQTFSSSSPVDFSGAAWDNLSWIQVTTSGTGEWKFWSFTFDPTGVQPGGVPEPVTMLLIGSGLLALGSLRRRTAS